MIKKGNKILYIVGFLAVVNVFWKLILPGYHLANDFHFYFKEELLEYFSFPQIWTTGGSQGLGDYSANTLWRWPVDILFGLGAKAGLGFNSLESIIFFIPFLILGLKGIWNFLSFYKISDWAKLPSAIFYVANTYVLLLLDGGQLSVALAYAFFPWAYILVFRGISGRLSERLKAGIGIAVLGFLDVRFVYLVFILLILHFVYFFTSFVSQRKLAEEIKNWVKTGFVVVFVFLGLNSFWIIPAILTGTLLLPATYSRTSQINFLSFATWKHAILVLAPHWYKNVFGKVTPVKFEFLIIPLLSFSAILFARKRKHILFWLLVGLLGIFMVKGSNPPLGSTYPWLFQKIPGLSLFRDPTKFFVFITLSYSLLIGATVDGLMKYIEPRLKIKSFKIEYVPILLLIYLVFLVSPVYGGKLTGLFSEPYQKSEFLKVAEIIKADKNFGRTFWISSRMPLSYASGLHPSVEAIRFVQERPFAISTVGTYEVFNFLREAPYMGEIFDISGIKYIAYPYPDTRREDLKQDNIDYYYAFLHQLDDKAWIDGRLSEPPVALLKTKSSQDHFFLTSNTFFVVGSDDIYNSLLDDNLLDLSENALIFAEEKPEMGKLIEKIPGKKVILYRKNSTDYSATFIDKDKFIFPAESFDFDPDESGWWKRETPDLIWWRNFLHEKYAIENKDFDYGGGWGVAEGNLKTEIPSSKFQKGNVLLARVMVSGRGGKIGFSQNGVKVGEIMTEVEKPSTVELKLTGYKQSLPLSGKKTSDTIFEFTNSDFTWFEVGTLSSSGSLTLETEGEINVVNALVSVTKSDWERIRLLVDGDELIRWNDLDVSEKKELFSEKTEARVTYSKISPTHYKVKIEGLNKPNTLVFSETYDTLWKIKNKAGGEKGVSYPLYSLINGFSVDEDGEYDVYFLPQKYVYSGLIVSSIALLIITGFLIFTRNKKLKAL